MSMIRPIPTREHERNLTFDVLRGISLFGILLVNMSFYTLPMFYYPAGFPHWSSPVDRLLDTLIHYLGETEFLTIFSFLFGLGFAFQLARLDRSPHANRIFLRRIAVLLAFGLFHAFFVWMGDVLVWYAVVGVGLLFFRHARPSHLLIVATGIFAVRIIRLEWLLARPVTPRSQVQNTEALVRVQECLRIYAHGSFREIFEQRARDVWFQYTHPTDTLLHIFLIFVLGLYIGKVGLLRGHSKKSHSFFTSLWRFGAVVGVGGHLLRYGLAHLGGKAVVLLMPSLVVLTELALAAFYVASVVLAMYHPKIARLLAPFAAIGRSTLTNYLGQSIIVTTLAYAYGFALYGELTPLDWLSLSLLIYSTQAALSFFWLRRYSYGPAEWLSRILIYGRWIPLRLPSS